MIDTVKEKLNFKLKCGRFWNSFITDELKKPYMQDLVSFLEDEYANGKTIYPEKSDIFCAFEFTPLEKTKVVIIGQDPYHGPNQAHGLCFSVRPSVAVPPSLVNIYKEINQDLGLDLGKHGHLASWAKQGVMLLNSVLTVEAGLVASHQGRGWEEFTDAVIAKLNASDKSLVFVLWGAYAQKKGKIIDSNKHLVLSSAHPSPLSAYRGFFGNKHFSKINKFLKKNNYDPIDWDLPDLV